MNLKFSGILCHTIEKVGAKFGVLSSTLKVIFESDDMRHKRDVSTKKIISKKIDNFPFDFKYFRKFDNFPFDFVLRGKGMDLRNFKVSFNFFVAIKIAVCLKTTVDN